VANYFNVSSLRDVTLSQLQSVKAQIPPMLYKRAHHVLSENERVLTMFTALNDNNIAVISQAMKASHNSLRDDFDVTTKALDGLVTMIDAVLGEKGGVRMTGGGFGGCVIALVPDDLVTQVINVVNEQYEAEFSLSASIYLSSASQGAFR
jgi:galactokinase